MRMVNKTAFVCRKKMSDNLFIVFFKRTDFALRSLPLRFPSGIVLCYKQESSPLCAL